MLPNSAPRMNVVRKEDKEARLKDFIRKDISARKASAGAAHPEVYRLIALSIESPVAKALAALSGELVEAGIVIEAIFAKPAGLTADTAVSTFEAAAGGVRCAADVRLLDAHEQLILGPDTVWVGDCMRRDPGKRDAYECYADASAEASQWALRSFRRLWNQAQPVTPSHRSRMAPAPLPMSVLEPLLASIGEAGPVTASTRH